MSEKEVVRQLLFYWNNPHYSDEQLIEYTGDILNAYVSLLQDGGTEQNDLFNTI